MQRRTLSTLFAAVVCVCFATAVVSAQDEDDFSDLIDQFRPYWESVTVETVLFNPEEAVDEDTEMQIQLSIQGAVEIPDHNSVIGISWMESSVLVLDANGEELYSTEGMSLFGRFYNAPYMFTGMSWNDEGNIRLPLSVDVPIDANTLAARAPDSLESLSRLEWSTSFLLADVFTTADVSFEPNETWVKLVPGLEILVEEALIVEDEYTCSIQVLYDPNLVGYGGGTSWHFKRNATPQPVIFVGLDMLNEEGDSVYELSSSTSRGTNWSSTQLEDGLVFGTSYGNGSCTNCGQITTIRFTFAHNPYEWDVQLALEDIPVPDVDL